jgi:hypothetical protein
VPSLQSGSHLRSTTPLLLLTKVVSLIVFTFLLAAGWVGLSYLKSDMASRSARASQLEKPARPANTPASATPVDQKPSPEVIRLATPVRLVYSCKTDKDHYHTSTHLSNKCERSALSEQSALQRGLKPCSICIPE